MGAGGHRPHPRRAHPRHGRGDGPRPRRRRGGRRPRGESGPARLRGRMARHDGAGARPRPLPHRGGRPRAARGAGGAGDAQLRQADRGGGVRRRRRRHLLRVLRRPRHQGPRRGAPRARPRAPPGPERGGGGGRGAVRGLRQPGRGLLGGKPRARAAAHLRQDAPGHGGEGEGHPPRARAGPRHQDGTAGLAPAARARPALPGHRPARGARGPGRRPSPRPRPAARILRGADHLLRRGEQRAHRPRGDLRPRDGGHPLRRRGGGAAHRQRQRLRPGRRRLEPRHIQVPAHGQAPPGRRGLGEPHAADVRGGALGRLQDVRHRPRAGALRPRGVPAGQAGPHQPQRAADRLVLTVAGQSTPRHEVAASDYVTALVASFLGWTLDAFDFFVLVFVLPSVAGEFGKGIPALALTITVTLAFRPVGALVFGLLADRYGRRLPLMIDLVFYSVVEVLSGLAPSYAVFLVLRALFGIGMGGEWGVGASLAMEKVPPRWRGMLSGFLQEGYAVGYLLAACCYFFVFPRWGWRPMFFIGGLPALLALFVRFRVRESAVWEKTRAESWSHLGRGIASQWRLFLYLVALMMMMNFVSHGTQDMYPTFLKVQRGFSPQTVAKIAVTYNVGALVGGIFFGLVSDRYGRRRSMVVALLLAVV